MNRGGKAYFRSRHLHIVINALLRQHVWVILSVQGKIDLKSHDRLLVLENEADDKEFRKSWLINKGIGFALQRFSHWKWLWQCDADILFPVKEVLKILPDIPRECHVVSPWKQWARLTQGQSAVIADFPEGPRIFEDVSARRINHGAGAGGIMLSRKLLEDGFRWDEGYTDWGWEDADAVRRAVKWFAGEGFLFKGDADAVHLWHENDRVLNERNGELFFDGKIPQNSHSGVLLESKTKFLVVCLGRSGGNLFGRTLDLHSDIHCDNSEPFIHSRGDSIAARNLAMREWTLFGPLKSRLPVVGMRMQYAVDAKRFGFTAEEYVKWAKSQDFSLIHLYRTNVVEIVISNCVARRTGRWINYRYPDKKYFIPPDEFMFFYSWIREQQRKWILLMEEAGALQLTYEGLCKNWDATMGKAFDFLGVEKIVVEPPIQKQTKKPHKDYVSNWAQIEDMLNKHHAKGTK